MMRLFSVYSLFCKLCLRLFMFLDANKREEILPQERMFGFLDSLVAHGEKTVDPCNSSIRRKGVCHRS